jgi:hypothetical protein
MNSLSVPPNWDLPTLNVFIAQQENFLRGQLSAISSDGDQTILVIDDAAGKKPDSNTIVTTTSPPPGATVVGSGQIRIENQPVFAIAYRP